MRRFRRATIVLACLACVGGLASAGAAQATSDSRAHHVSDAPYRVRRTDQAMRLDARLAELVWRDADSIVDFRQREPLEGAPASERTVVKAVRDAERLYIAVHAYDGEMAAVRSSQLRRDADLSSDHNVTILIDSYRDRRGAFLF